MSSIEKNEENTNESSNIEYDLKCNEHNISSNSNSFDNDSQNLEFNDFDILPQNYTEPNHTYKVIIIGDSGVGKSCLANRIISEKFNEEKSPTIGFEYFPFLVRYKDNILKLELWDTCGQEIYRSLIKSFYNNSSMAIIVYSIDNKNSFDSIPEWIRQCRNSCSPDIKLILIGNKKDLQM
jgi:small GTP-binding protein